MNYGFKHINVVQSDRFYLLHPVVFSGDLDRSRSIGWAFCDGGDAGFDGGDPGASFSSAASALQSC